MLCFKRARRDVVNRSLTSLSLEQIDPMHVDTLVNYGSLLKSVHKEVCFSDAANCMRSRFLPAPARHLTLDLLVFASPKEPLLFLWSNRRFLCLVS